MRDNSLVVRWAGGLDFAALVTAAVLLAGAPALTAGESTYDFNAAGLHPGALASQDHWQNRQGDSVISISEVTGAFGPPTRLVAMAAGPVATASRLNAPQFGYRLAGSETEAVFEFDTLAMGTALLALGRDFDDTIPYSEYGFTFGISHQTLLFMRAGWDGGFSMGPDDPFESRLSPNDWVTVRLTANLAANGGDGLGTVSLRNNSRGETTFNAHPDLSNLPLGLNGMAPGAQPANWNGVYIRLENGGMIARLTLPFSPGNRPPNAHSQSTSGPNNAPLPITLTATDPDGDVLAFAVVTSPQFGTLTGTAPNLTYQPSPGQPADEFEFEVTDPHGAKSRASVRIRVMDCARVTTGLRGWWPGTVVEGQASDVAGNHPLSLPAGAAVEPNGLVGAALRLPPTAVPATVPDTIDLWMGEEGFTLETWVRLDGPTVLKFDKLSAASREGYGGQPPVRTWYEVFYRGWILELSLGTVRFNFATDYSNTGAPDFSNITPESSPLPQPLEPGRWYHVAGSYRPGQMRVYLDGELILERAGPGSQGIEGRLNSSSPLSIRTYQAAASLDELGFYGRALSEDEIRAMVAAGSHGKCPPNPRVVTPSLLPVGLLGVPYRQTMAVEQAAKPFQFSVAAGSILPPGLQLEPVGLLSGSPAATGDFAFDLLLTDALGQTAHRTFSLRVLAQPPACEPLPGPFWITPHQFPVARQHARYSQLLTMEHGAGRVQFALLSSPSSLPLGLELRPDGLLTGTPTTFGAFSFLVRATDSAGRQTEQDLRLEVRSLFRGLGCLWIDPDQPSDWDTIFSWGFDGMPGAGDEAFTSAGSAPAIVSRPIELGRLQLGLGTLIQARGEGAFKLNFGGDWQAAYLAVDMEVASGATLTINGAQSHDLPGRVLRNLGTVVWSEGALRGGSGTRIENAGLWLVECDQAFNHDFGGSSDLFVNSGVFRKTAGSGATTFTAGVAFANNGLVEVESGTLNLNGIGSGHATFHTALNTIVNFNSDFAFAEGSALTGPGSSRLVAGTHTLTGVISAENLELAGGMLAGEHVLNGTLTWSSGHMNNTGSTTISPCSTLRIVGDNQHDLATHRLINLGTVRWLAGSVRGGGNTVIDNVGLWDAQSDNALNAEHGGNLFFNNLGTFRKSAGPGTTSVSQGVIFNNSSLVEATSGRLQINGAFNHAGTGSIATGPVSLGGGGSITGRLTVGANAIVQLTGGEHTVTASGVVEGPGAWGIAGATVTVEGAVTNRSLSFTGGYLLGAGTVVASFDFLWTAGHMGGGGVTLIPADATLTIATEANHDLPVRVLRNLGTVVWNGGPLRGGSGTRVENDGLWLVECDQAFNHAHGGIDDLFFNTGVFRKTAGSGATTFTAGVAFANNGLVEVESGTLNLNGIGSGHGTFHTTLNNVVNFNSNFDFAAGSALTGPGSSRLVAGTHTLTGAIPAENLELAGGALGGEHVLNGTLTWSSGHMNNTGSTTISRGSALRIVGDNQHDLATHRLINLGTVLWLAGSVRGGGGTVIDNVGLWDAQSDNALNAEHGGNLFFNNPGTFRKSAGPGTTSIAAGVVFDNDGTVEVQHGVLGLQTASQELAGLWTFGLHSLSDFGRVSLSGNASLAGNVGATLAPGFIPNAADSFRVLTCANRAGTFANDSVSGGQGVILTPDHRPDGVVLIVAARQGPLLEPVSASVLPGTVIAFAVSDGQPPFTFTLESNQSGATLHASGAYTAGPNAGTDTVRVTDGAGATATATVTVLGCEPLADLLGWWRGEGNALDSLGQSPGTPQQGATFAPGHQGQAFQLDGLDDYVEIPATPRLTVSGAFTVAAWVQPNTASASGTVITKYNSALGRASWGLLLVEGGLHLYASVDGTLAGAQWAQSAPNLVPANAWTHVAGAFDATRQEWRLYINGREVPSTLGREAIVSAVFDSPEPVRLGTFVDQNGNYASCFGGRLDEVLLYARALTPDEILAVSEGCRSAPPLAIQVDPQTGEVTLSWPLPADGWVMEWAPDLGPTGTPTWTVLPPPYTATATHLLVKVPATEAQRFFRLRPAGR